jgi:hypothetical protein
VLRPGFFAVLAAAVAVLLVARLVRRRPLLGSRAHSLSVPEAITAVGSLGLLVFHCAAMFAPDVVAALDVLDGPAAVASDLSDPVGQAAYWIPAALLLVALRRLWWPAPIGLAAALTAVGWTMYGGFTLDEHLAAIAVAVIGIAAVVAALVSSPGRRREASTRVAT